MESIVLIRDDSGDLAQAEPIALAAALDSLKRVTERYCFDATCPVCGQALNAGDRHECRPATPRDFCECEQQGLRHCGTCDG